MNPKKSHRGILWYTLAYIPGREGGREGGREVGGYFPTQFKISSQELHNNNICF